ncbi:HD domain-containing protein [Nocardioides sp. SYSU DS0663]|uniref:HD domain-containing protein n=1 Tax=Nocardioides sp. SYSU DS0663 TaxID=3416445 RepID=UPI003F4C55D4
MALPLASWPLPTGEELRDRLAAAYAAPGRDYHDTRHLAEVLARLAELAERGAAYDRVPVLLAAWFHDGVYDGERDAEERSAVWAEDALEGLVPPDVVAEVARLVRLTETHRPEDGDANGSALSDADLAILAAPDERYREYVASVRREFAHLPDELFRKGRAQVLRALAEKEHLFHTAWARAQWEAPARANLERELAELTIAGG